MNTLSTSPAPVETGAPFADWVQQRLHMVEQALSDWVGQDAPANLGQAMRYAVLDGGKRLRPLLVLATSEALGGMPNMALRAACAVELIHAYSLVHDDMPCMDNDVLRRGKPTVHVQFGEATAMLAGDALQALAFELLLPASDDAQQLIMQARLCRLLAQAAGSDGMAGGQAIDLHSVGKTLTEAELSHMHQLKTGALLKASVLMGAVCATSSPSCVAALERYGHAIGLAFQVVDDILDVTADSATLGKTAGKDAAHDKPTYVSLMGLETAQDYARTLYQQAVQALDTCQLPNANHLGSLAQMVVSRAF